MVQSDPTPVPSETLVEPRHQADDDDLVLTTSTQRAGQDVHNEPEERLVANATIPPNHPESEHVWLPLLPDSKPSTAPMPHPPTSILGKRSNDVALNPERVSTRPSRNPGPRRGTDTVTGWKEVDCPVHKHARMYATPPSCTGRRFSTTSEIRAHLNRSRAHSSFINAKQCSRCLQDFVEGSAYYDHVSRNTCPPRPHRRGDIDLLWAQLYLAIYPDAVRIPLPGCDELGWLPDSVLAECRVQQEAALSPPSLDLFEPIELSESPSSPHNFPHWSLNITHPAYMGHPSFLKERELAQILGKPYVGPRPQSSQSKLSVDGKTSPQIVQSLTLEEDEEHDRHATSDQDNQDGKRAVQDPVLNVTFLRESELPIDYPVLSATETATMGQTTRKDQSAGLRTLPSDSGYQSALSTDTGSISSRSSSASSLGISPDFLQDFIAFFGDTLVEKAGARQWIEHALLDLSPEKMRTTLVQLLKCFSMDLSKELASLESLEAASLLRSVKGTDAARAILETAAKVIRRYRPSIAQYFVNNSVAARTDAVTLSDRLRTLGHHLSLNEKVGLLSRQGMGQQDPPASRPMINVGEDDDAEDFVEDEDILTQLGPIQDILVSSDAFQRLASDLRRAFDSNSRGIMDMIEETIVRDSKSTGSFQSSQAHFRVAWDVSGFMYSQYGKAIPSASVLVLTGSLLCAQATTCGEYVQTTWPSIGPSFLKALDQAILGDREGEITIIPGLKDCAPGLRIRVGSDKSLDLSVSAATEHVIVELAQLLAWIGSALSNSPFGESMSYGVPSITIRSKDAHEGDFDPSNSAVPSLDIKFSHRLLENTATVCWLPLFTGMTIATGFPIPGRSGEIGLEISLGLLAAVAGVCHATEFEGGIVIKGFCHMFVPVERTQNGVQWHAVTNEDSRTYLTYHDGISLCERRASKQEVGVEDLQSTRAFLGWCRVAHSRLGEGSNDFENLDCSGAPEASNSIQFTGAQFGLQQIGTVAGNFIIGAKQTRHCIKFSGTYRNMILAAENILVVLYDTGTKRGYLFNSTDVMLHMMQHRHSRRPFKVSNNRIELRINVPAGSSATQVLLENENIPISDDDTYLFKHEIINIFSIVENLWNKTSTRQEEAPGMEMPTRYGTYLQGYEFNAIVRQHGTYKLIESKLEKSHGGWPQLIKDTGALVLLGNGFGDLILPADEDKSRLCNLWQRLPSGLDYLAAMSRVLEDLYDLAGCRTSRKYLTTTHLQWHKGESKLFDACENTKSCRCDRVQEVFSSFSIGTIIPPDVIAEKGAVIFGHHGSLQKKKPTKSRSTVKQEDFFSHPNTNVEPTIPCDHSEAPVTLRCSSLHDLDATEPVLPNGNGISTCAIRPVEDFVATTREPDRTTDFIALPKKRSLVPEILCMIHDPHAQEGEICESSSARHLKRKKPFRIANAEDPEGDLADCNTFVKETTVSQRVGGI